jgi:hypothetical protein
MRYGLRTLLILLAIGPPLLAGGAFIPNLLARCRAWQWQMAVERAKDIKPLVGGFVIEPGDVPPSQEAHSQRCGQPVLSQSVSP